jgi:hypothetical protein
VNDKRLRLLVVCDMRTLSAIAGVTVVLLIGCRPADVVYQTAPAAPDLAVYGGGIFFSSGDGLRTYDRVAIVPGRLREDVLIIFPDRERCDVTRLSPSVLDDHDVQYSIMNDDGKGTFWLRVSGAMFASFQSDKATWVSLYDTYPRGVPISLEYKGKTIAVPIERSELEKLIGKPDETLLDTMPPDE